MLRSVADARTKTSQTKKIPVESVLFLLYFSGKSSPHVIQNTVLCSLRISDLGNMYILYILPTITHLAIKTSHPTSEYAIAGILFPYLSHFLIGNEYADL